MVRQVTLFSVCSQFGFAVLGVEPRANEPHPQSVGGQGLLLIVCLFELLFKTSIQSNGFNYRIFKYTWFLLIFFSCSPPQSPYSLLTAPSFQEPPLCLPAIYYILCYPPFYVFLSPKVFSPLMVSFLFHKAHVHTYAHSQIHTHAHKYVLTCTHDHTPVHHITYIQTHTHIKIKIWGSYMRKKSTVFVFLNPPSS